MYSSYPNRAEVVKPYGIQFNGTSANLREAVATLTTNLKPNMQDTISDFLCHSRRSHNKYYRFQHGKLRLIDTFQGLESMKSNPYDEVDTTVNNDISTEIY